VVLAAGVWAGSMLVSPVPMSAGLCLAAAVVAVTAAPRVAAWTAGGGS
jgi:hypothetical protein